MACEVVDSFLGSEDLRGQAKIVMRRVEGDAREPRENDCTLMQEQDQFTNQRRQKGTCLEQYEPPP